MAWWDHEELKSVEYRSDRYIVSFPAHYTKKEISEAKKRIEEEKRRLYKNDREIPITIKQAYDRLLK